MNPRERYLEALLFGSPDRVPLSPGGPRESTRAAWYTQGLREDVPHVDQLAEELGVPCTAFETTVHLPQTLKMIPTFEETVLEHRDGHYVVRDWMGAITEISDTFDYTYIRTAKDFVTRKWHRFPVQTEDDWEDMAWRYDPTDPERFGEEFEAGCYEAERSDRAVAVSVNGPFWQIREWVGMEPLCVMMVEVPEFVAKMAEFWRQFTLEVLETIFRHTRVDALLVSEDMAYKAHSIISPAMARQFLQPTYQSWHELLTAYDVAIYDMDSDGWIEELIPVWIESGFNCCNPIEVAAGNDIVAFREQFGRQIAYHGAIDKRAIAAGGQAMRDEVLRVVPPMLIEGGFIPGCDHGVPPDISWPNFVEFTRLLAELSGWL